MNNDLVFKIVVLVLILSLLANIGLGIKIANTDTEVIETYVQVTDTVVVDSIKIQEKIKLKYITTFDTLYVFETDTTKDSVQVAIPIEHKVYKDTIKKDSITYNLQIDYSGFKPTLDRIALDATFNQTEIKIMKPKKWRQYVGVSLQVGYGINYDLMTKTPTVCPYIGLGVSYGFGYTW